MKIGFAARYSPEDKKAWSGILYFTSQQLRQYGELSVFHYRLPKLLQEWLTTQKSLSRRVFRKHTAVEFLESYARYFSKRLSRDLEKNPVDILFVPAASQLIAYVKTNIPIIYMTDASFRQLQGYYASFSNLGSRNIRQGVQLDRRAFQRAAHCMLASEWCRHSAIHDYGIAPGSISVVPFGANLEKIPGKEELRQPEKGSCRLLFLGVEWERKGGEIALAAFRQLQKENLHPRLYIIGCVPPADLSGEKEITVIPFLDKNKPEDRERLHSIFLQTDFLLLPTRAECAGIVFCEAAAYGIPSITTATGGVTDYVKDGVNGFALPFHAGGEAYARVIAGLCHDRDQVSRLKESSRQRYEDELNWDNWGRRFSEIAAKILEQKERN